MNSLTKISDDISNLTELTRIDFSYNKLPNIPDSFVGLTKIEFLYLNNNNLTEIPMGVKYWKNIRKFDLRGNRYLKEDGDGKTTVGVRSLLEIFSNRLIL